MRRVFLVSAAAIALISSSSALSQGPWQPASETQQSAAVSILDRNGNGLRLRTAEGIVAIAFWSDRTVRVSVNRTPEEASPLGLAVEGSPRPVSWTLKEDDHVFVLTTSAMKIAVDKATGLIRMLDDNGETLVGEADPGRRVIGAGAQPDGVVQQRFAIGGNQAVYGLGQHQAGLLDYRGTTVRLQQANTDVGVPVLLSSAGYGIFWNNASVTDVDVTIPQAVDRIVFRSQAGRGIDYFLFAGPDVDQVIGAYRDLTGQAPLMPRWAWGLWQSKERYTSQEELLDVASRYRKLGIPLDAVIQDWQYWKPGEWGSHRMDPERFPDPKAMLDRLHQQNVHSIISVWPRFDPGLDTTAALEAAGGLYPRTYPNVYPAGKGRWYDAFSAKARGIYWDSVSQRLGTLGFDGYWLDGSEAELGGLWGEMRDTRTGAGPGALVYNAYPLMHTTAVHDGMARDFPDKRPIILTRSAYAGQQRNAAITWSGDVHGSWDVFRRQVPAAVNFSMTGIPYWSVDIGGFFGGDPATPEYQELFTRWLQFAVFNPMFRIHGTGKGKEIYNFPEAAQLPLIDAVKLRYRLLPFFYAQSWRVTDAAGSFLYPVGTIFPQDASARNLPDQYMFGRSILVSPVVEKGATSRQLYLPAGVDWYDFWTGARQAGGRRIAVDAPIERFPIHVRAGSILPLGAAVQYAAQTADLPVELRVYRGADGSFTLYDDAGDGQGWRRGERATIDLRLDDKAGTLLIGARQGGYPGMARNRTFRVVEVSPANGLGLAEGVGQDVRYDGREILVRLGR